MTTGATRMLRALVLAAAGCCTGAAGAATAAGSATATVVDPAAVAAQGVNQLLERFAPTMVVPNGDAVPGTLVRILPPPPSPANVGGGAGQPAAGSADAVPAGDAAAPADGTVPSAVTTGPGASAPAAGAVQTTRNADGSVSLSITGGSGLAHAVSRSSDGQVRVDFN